MNTPGAGPVTTIHLILIAILAALTIAMIARGIILKRRRAEAQRVQDEAIEQRNPSPHADIPPVADTPTSVRAVPPADPVVAVDKPAPVEETPQHATLANEPVAAAAPFDPGIAPVPPVSPDHVDPVEPAPQPTAPLPSPPPAAERASDPVDDAVAAPTPAAPPAPVVDPGTWPVTTLKGLGPKVATMLGQLGVATVADMAGLDLQAAQAIDAQLGAFTGRMGRDRWIEQAQLLTAGNIKGFEAAFGKL